MTYQPIKHYDTNEKKLKKGFLPIRCKNCYFKNLDIFTAKRYCRIHEDEIRYIDYKSCTMPQRHKEEREKLKASTWTTFNQYITKPFYNDLLKDFFWDNLIYNDFEVIIHTFKVWELLAILSASQTVPFLVECLNKEDQNKAQEKMDSVLENPEVLLDNLNAHQEMKEDSAYDYATAIILKNYFSSRTRNNEMKSYYEKLNNNPSIETIAHITERIIKNNILEETNSNIGAYQKKI